MAERGSMYSLNISLADGWKHRVLKRRAGKVFRKRSKERMFFKVCVERRRKGLGWRQVSWQCERFFCYYNEGERGATVARKSSANTLPVLETQFSLLFRCWKKEKDERRVRFRNSTAIPKAKAISLRANEVAKKRRDDNNDLTREMTKI